MSTASKDFAQTDRQADRQTDRHTHRGTYRHYKNITAYAGGNKQIKLFGNVAI